MIITDQSLLRLPCADVLPHEILELKYRLEQELQLSAQQGNPGIGLAAPQIGIYKKIAIVRMPNLQVDLVNAEIVEQYHKFLFRDEACLSFPGKSIQSWRYDEIVVSNNSVFPHRFIVTGLFAVCIQHELDHLSGRLLSDIAVNNSYQK